MATLATERPVTIRQTLTDAQPELAPGILESLTEASKSTKSAWGTCGHCKRRVQVEIQDAQAAIAASKALMDYTEGKPSTAGDQADTGLVIRRYVATGPELQQLPAWQALAEAGDLEALATAILAATTVVDLTPAAT